MIDAHDRPKPRFPPGIEGAVRDEMDAMLERLDAKIGYCSAANGGDHIFIEAMLDRGGEVDITLEKGDAGLVTATTDPPLEPGNYTLEIEFCESNPKGSAVIEGVFQGYVARDLKAIYAWWVPFGEGGRTGSLSVEAAEAPDPGAAGMVSEIRRGRRSR